MPSSSSRLEEAAVAGLRCIPEQFNCELGPTIELWSSLCTEHFWPPELDGDGCRAFALSPG